VNKKNIHDAHEYIDYLLGVIDGINNVAKQFSATTIIRKDNMRVIDILSNFEHMKKYACEIERRPTVEKEFASVEELSDWHERKFDGREGGPDSDALDEFYLILDKHHKGIGDWGDDGGVDTAYKALPVEAKIEVTRIILRNMQALS